MSRAICFSVQDVIFPRYNPCKCFLPLEISLQDMIFSEITDNPLKSQIIGPKIHQTVAQLTDSDLSLITKAFGNSRGQTSRGEGKNSFLPTSTWSLSSDIQ